MDKNDLKIMWQDVHNVNQETVYDKINVEKTIRMKHSKNISRVLSDIKLKILVYAMILLIFIGLMLYAFVYLSLHLSVISIISLALVGLFLLMNTISECNRLLILTKTADNISVKESLLFFRRKLNTIKTVDFVSYLIFLYMGAIWISYNYIADIGGIKNLFVAKQYLPLPLLGIFILLLLILPWFIKYQHKQRYKKLYINLNDSAIFLM